MPKKPKHIKHKDSPKREAERAMDSVMHALIRLNPKRAREILGGMKELDEKRAREKALDQSPQLE